MLTRIFLPGLLLVPQLALARNAGWFLKGAETVEIAGAVEVPLYRGTLGDHRPMIAVDREVDGKKRSILAVVDVGHHWTTIGRDLANELGIQYEATDLWGEWAQVATIDALTIDGVTLRNLNVQVVKGDELVLGFGAIDDLAIAVLPSTGTVKLVPSGQGPQLVAATGEFMKVNRQTKGKWTEKGEKVWGNGLSFAIDGSIAGRDGLVRVDTASHKTYVTTEFRGTDKRTRGGVDHYRARGRIASAELAESWVEVDESLVDPDDKFVGTFGYDQLYVMDIAVSPSHGIASIKKAADVKYTSTVDRALELATANHKAAGLDREDERVDRPPRMSFEGEEDITAKEGDKGDAKVAGLEGALAQALWDAGKLDEAMPHFLKAAEAAGDRCGPQMELGQKRLAWSGALQEQKFIIELIRQPLREAGELWDRWDAMTPELRDAVRRYADVPPGTFKVQQDPRCKTAWGTLMAAYVQQGNTAESSRIYTDHYGSDPVVAFAQAISLLAQDQAATAEIPIREAMSWEVEESVNFKLGLGRALAEQGKRPAVEAIVDELPGLELEHPLTAALMAVEWGRILDGEEGAAAMAERMVKQDAYWIPGQLVGVLMKSEFADINQVGAEILRQRGRFAGDNSLEAHAAVYKALQGDPTAARKELRGLQKGRPPTADLFAGMALVASLRGNQERLDEALKELRLRYPTIPVKDLGLRISAN